jgi:hypothetical protein
MRPFLHTMQSHIRLPALMYHVQNSPHFLPLSFLAFPTGTLTPSLLPPGLCIVDHLRAAQEAGEGSARMMKEML